MSFSYHLYYSNKEYVFVPKRSSDIILKSIMKINVCKSSEYNNLYIIPSTCYSSRNYISWNYILHCNWPSSGHQVFFLGVVTVLFVICFNNVKPKIWTDLGRDSYIALVFRFYHKSPPNPGPLMSSYLEQGLSISELNLVLLFWLKKIFATTKLKKFRNIWYVQKDMFLSTANSTVSHWDTTTPKIWFKK